MAVNKCSESLQKGVRNGSSVQDRRLPRAWRAFVRMSRLPAHKLKIQEFTHSGEVVDIARDKVSADSPRGERDEHVKMNLSGFVNVESLGGNQPLDDLSRLNSLSFIRGDDAEIFR